MVFPCVFALKSVVDQPLKLRVMNAGDIEFAASLSALAGWNQTPDDWRRFLKYDPSGCFVAEWNDAPAGTATTASYGKDVAWIGMLLVHPDCRRHGIGKALLHQCIEYLQQRGVRSIKLDATPLGKKLYDTIGFRDEWTLTRWETYGLAVPFSGQRNGRVAAWSEAGLRHIAEIDLQGFGVSRQTMLGLTADQSRLWFHAGDDGTLDGHALLRPGLRANYLGPVVALTPEAGEELVRLAISKTPNQPVYWDIPDQNTAAVELARSLGFTAQRQLTRMYLGQNHRPGIPAHIFAIAAPEIG
jgi:GNAT superfamily N-acetyltransferase